LTKKRGAAGLSQIYGPKAVESGLSQANGNISFLEGRVEDPTEAISEVPLTPSGLLRRSGRRVAGDVGNPSLLAMAGELRPTHSIIIW